MLSFLFLLLHPFSRADAQKAEALIGREILNFTLPSTHDRLVNYADDYYGKYHLVMTFFPAAFTPI
jgi:peroxiredoxin